MTEAGAHAVELTIPRAEPRWFGRWRKDPWRKPRILATLTWAYLAWSILPVLIAILISFNAGRSNAQVQTLGLRWWFNDPDQQSLFQDPTLRRAILQTYLLSFLTVVIAVPIEIMADFLSYFL